MENVIFIMSLLVKQVSSTIFCQENEQHSMLQSLGLDNLTIQAFGFSVLVLYFAYVIFSPKRKSCGIERECSLKNFDTQPTDVALTSPANKNVLCDYPVQHSAGHVVFEKTGVEVIGSDSFTPSDQCAVPNDLVIQASSESEQSGLLEEDELPLSPGIKLISSVSKLNGQLEVWVPHGANMVLTGQKWNIILKEYQNNRWVTVSQTESFTGQGIKNIVCKSNHVRFNTDHLSTFIVVGKFDKSSLSVFKRMKVAAFCTDTRVGEDLVMRLYCFDDCEWSFEKLMAIEHEKGGKMMSSIESLDFSVTSKEDVEITIKDVAGWHLDKAAPMRLSHESLRNSFNIIPQCDLVFHPSNKTRDSGFFVVMALTHGSSIETVMYATSSLKKRSLGNSFNGVVSAKTGKQVEVQEACNRFIVNL